MAYKILSTQARDVHTALADLEKLVNALPDDEWEWLGAPGVIHAATNHFVAWQAGQRVSLPQESQITRHKLSGTRQ